MGRVSFLLAQMPSYMYDKNASPRQVDNLPPMMKHMGGRPKKGRQAIRYRWRRRQPHRGYGARLHSSIATDATAVYISSHTANDGGGCNMSSRIDNSWPAETGQFGSADSTARPTHDYPFDKFGGNATAQRQTRAHTTVSPVQPGVAGRGHRLQDAGCRRVDTRRRTPHLPIVSSAILNRVQSWRRPNRLPGAILHRER